MMKQILGALVLLAICAWWPIAHAHEVRPGFLEIRALGDDTFDVLWKVPANGEYRLAMYVKLPAKCKGEPTSGTFAGGAFVERWRAACPGGLVGERVAIDGLSATRTDVLARFIREDATTQTVRLTPEDTSFEVTAEPNAWQVARTYLLLGIEHILLGIDHLLFVLGLLFLVGSWEQTKINWDVAAPASGLSTGWFYGVGLVFSASSCVADQEVLQRLDLFVEGMAMRHRSAA